MSLLRFQFLAVLATLGGCSSQATPSYQGNPLATLHGTVDTSSTDSSTTTPLEAALLWSDIPPGADGKDTLATRAEVGTSVDVSGTFPARFTLEVYTPPPAAALFSCTSGSGAASSGHLGIAEVEAFAAGTSAVDPPASATWGFVSGMLVAYADADIPASAGCVGGAWTKGYHLLSIGRVGGEDAGGANACGGPDCQGPWPYVEVDLSTSMTLTVIDPNDTATPPPTPTTTP